MEKDHLRIYIYKSKIRSRHLWMIWLVLHNVQTKTKGEKARK